MWWWWAAVSRWLVVASAAAPHARVMVVSKGPTDDGCTAQAQGGIAAAVGPG